MSEPTADDDVDEIEAVIRRWAGSIRRRDLDGVVANHHEDVVMFDVPPPERGVRGIDAYASAWPAFFEWVQAGARFEIDELHIVAGDDVAFAWALLWCGTDADLRSAPDRRLRLSFGLGRQAGGWEIVHEHHSYPLS